MMERIEERVDMILSTEEVVMTGEIIMIGREEAEDFPDQDLNLMMGLILSDLRPL